MPLYRLILAVLFVRVLLLDELSQMPWRFPLTVLPVICPVLTLSKYMAFCHRLSSTFFTTTLFNVEPLMELLTKIPFVAKCVAVILWPLPSKTTLLVVILIQSEEISISLIKMYVPGKEIVVQALILVPCEG